MAKNDENAQDRKKPAKKATGLGRGLNALFGEMQREEPLAIGPEGVAASDAGAAERTDGLRMISISEIRPNPDQPRQRFDDAALDELSDSMRERGVIQPIVVRTHGKHYQIVAGERRWRAAQRARLHHIPAIVRQLNDAETLEIAIVENVQRRDLNALEEAEAYARLKEDYGHSQAKLAEIVGKSRSHIANLIRLLELPEPVRELVAEDKLSMGHARALVNAPDATEIAQTIVKKGLSVRDTERLVRKALGGSRRKTSRTSASNSENDADIRAVENHLGDLLGLKVSIQSKGDGGAGAMTISYSNLDQLDLICQRLTGEHI
ncbi:chromosome partitioning protein, ParB family [Parasphingorhabdus marina DSM 22363]|uniref:Chromosome partitioning protein, ParB family n=1 Tax=Parasphingorhabdus marina DSM 22363 TaxID=1123272 RepID=A0A1N6CPA7_9SPHN|nr:ParB/RepB/Spo0J family partition protein [Parasphingorhabdus marina]SIN60275.1 chromosome partitioning protein, ParB family [Parasphingorhabdus marina DSM 22363]